MRKFLLHFILAASGLLFSSSAAAQTYCTTGLFSTGCTVGDEITSFTLGTSTFAKVPTCSAGSVGIFTSDTIQLSQGSVNGTTVIHGPTYLQGDAIWIDFNDDGDFADAGEHLWSSTTWALTNTGNVTVPLTAPLGNHRLRVRCNYNAVLTAGQSCANTSYGEVEDYTVKINPPPPCPPPIFLTLGSVSASSATINWSSTGTAFNIQYGPAGFVLGTGTSTTSTTASVSLTGLTANTTYDVYVQRNCTVAGNGLSTWSAKLRFTTPCTAVSSFPYTENFNGTTWVPSTGFAPYPTTIDACWNRTPIPTGFGQTGWVPGTGASYGFNTGPSADRSGTGQYIYVFSDGGGQTDTSKIVSPQFNLTSLTNPLLTFYVHMYGANIGSLKVQASTNGSTWTTVHTITGQQHTSATASWSEVIVDITSYKSSSTQLRFVGTKLSWGGSDIAIDDLSIAEAPPCPKPTAVAMTNIGANSATISFLSSGSSFPFEWGPVGFSQGTGTQDTATATGHVVTGLPANSLIDLYIMNDCSGAGNGLSAWVGPITFRTLCNASPEGYFENFDALATNTKNPCWYDFSTGGAHNVYAYATPVWSNLQPFSTPNVLYWYNSGAANSYVVTPELEGLDGDSTQIRFRMAHNNFNATAATVFIGTMSDRSNPATITWVDTIMPSQYIWNEYTVMFDNVAAGHKFVVFGRNNTNLYVEVDIDNFYFEGIPACPPPASASAQATSATTASVSWTGSGSAYQIEYGPTGFTQGTGTITSVTASPHSLTGLFANTCYDVYVRQDCGATGTSPWFGPIAFCTPCNAVAMPYTESFTTWPPSCFTFSKTSTWDWDQDAAGHARARFWSFSSGTATMRSAPITVTQKAQVKFKWAHQYQTFYPDDRVVLRAHVLGSSQWDTLIDLVGPTFNSPNSGATTPPPLSDFISELFYLDSATFVGQTAELEFIALTDYGPHAYIDDFVVEAVPSCPEPTQVTISNIQGFQANVNWSSAGGSQFVVEYGPIGFGQGSGMMDTVSGSPATITGLIPVTCYDVYVMALCGSNGNSTWAGPFNFCTTVSCPAPTNLNAGAVTTTTASISFTSGGAANWNYVVGPVGTTPGTGTVVQSTANPIMLTGLLPSTLYNIWIQDSCGVGDVSTWAGPYSFSTLCNNFSLNYSENFSSWVTPNPPTCWNTTGGTQQVLQTVVGTNKMVNFNFWNWISPNNAYLTSPAITISQKARLKVSWSRAGSTFYDDAMLILSKKTTSSTWDTVAYWMNPDCMCGAGNTTPGTAIDSILPLDTNYLGSDIQIRFVGISDWGPNFYLDNVIVEVDPAFASCPAPQALSASAITANSASLGWTSTASNFKISYGVGSFPASGGTKVTTSNNPYTLSGLLSSTQYSYYVKAICSTTDSSVWNGPYSFTTACSVFSAPFLETFNGTGLPNCWSTYNAGSGTAVNEFWKNTSGNWMGYGATGIMNHTVGGGNAMGVDGSVPTINDISLETPPISLVGLSSPELSFWLFSNNTTNPGDNNKFYVDFFDGTNWIDTVLVYRGDSAAWKQFTLSLSAYTITGPVAFRFNVDKDAGTAFYNDILIDDVEVTGLAGACPAPTNFAAPTTTIACDNMDVTWTPASGSIMSGILWDVAGFDPTLGGNLIANAQTPQNIAGLTPGTAYDFYLVDSCSAGVSAPVFLTASTVSAPLPTISFTQSQTSTTSIDAVVNLDASASTNYTSVTWVFGDGTPNGTNAIENHTYTQNQAYTVTLTLVNGCGSVDSTFVVNVTGIGIEETELSRTLNIFPNPTDGAFTVNFSLDQSTEVSIRVLDALGRSVIVREMGTVSGEQMIALDLSNNASGIYMVQIVTDKGTITKRLTLRNK